MSASPEALPEEEGGGVERVLLVAAHPDDAEFAAGGTIARLTDAGIEVTYLIVTDGDAGSKEPDSDRKTLGARRRSEQTAAASRLGVDAVEFLGYPDGGVVASIELRRDISRLIRRLRPERVICPSPERNWDALGASHPDHLATGEATVCAVYPDARNPYSHPELLAEGLAPHVVRELWLTGNAQPNRVVDVTATAERKLSALRCHESQIADPSALAERVLGRLAKTAEQHGLAEGHLAEAFRRVVSP